MNAEEKRLYIAQVARAANARAAKLLKHTAAPTDGIAIAKLRAMPLSALVGVNLEERIMRTPLGQLAEILAAPPPRACDLVDVARLILNDAAILRGHKRGRIDAVEGAIVRQALSMTGGNISAAARLVGIDRKAMERKLRRHKVRP